MRQQRAKRMMQWIASHQRLVIILTGTLLIGAAGWTAAYFVLKPIPPAPVHVVAPKPKAPEAFYSPLTGVKVADEAATHRVVTAIMIENSPDARPQSGLKESGVVFEAIAEGGITRFLALYQNEQPELVGPVRSLRMYYVDWLAPFNASVAHIGGSQNSLKEIRNGNYRDIDQFFNADTYWRATDRYAPHNVYTSFSRLNALNKQKGYTTSSFTGFTRKDSTASETPSATSVHVTISSASYNSSYTYDPSSNLYKRSQGGGAHVDREKGQITPRVIVVMEVAQQSVLEDGWREQINAIGSGIAYIFQDGTAQKVNWGKKARDQQITFTDTEGRDVPLARGQTWITAVPQGRGGVSWQ